MSTLIFTLPKVLRHQQAMQLLNGYYQQAKADASVSKVQLMANELKDFDSSALAVILDCARMAKQMKIQFIVERPPAKLLSLANIYGVSELLFGVAVN